MRAAAIVAGLALALVAGCAEPATLTAPAPQAVTTPRSLDWSQADCESMTWSVPVTAASLQPYLPAGFEPSPPDSSPAAVGAATLGFRAVECSYGFGEEKILRSMQSGQLFTPVLPPAELREERFTARYSYGWDVLVASAAWREHAAAWGLPVHDGGAAVHPSAQGWTGAFALDRVGSFEMTGRPFDVSKPAGSVDARAITAGSQDFALWDGEQVNRTVSTGIGTWTVSPESWVAAILGTTQGLATFEYSTYDLPHALVHWPGQALAPVEEDGGSLLPVSLPPRVPG